MSGSRPLVAVLDYGIGNLRSAQKSLEKVGADARLTADPALIDDAAAVVLPGVGHFGPCMRALHDTGLAQIAIDHAADDRPFLGICVGMQLLFEGSEEAPGIDGLGIMPGTIRRLPDGVKHPQMQWNKLRLRQPGPLVAGLPDEPWFYFVHSFAPEDSEYTTAVCDYGGEITAITVKDRVWATQFHPEKSGHNGLKLLTNFVEMARS
ncbi:MAG: imidazole glycerol phosphate synthase subunit HisH [Actinomycetia bacterium]|nr:imidazole glycerol phosphate synthase subunit HisH [Actinomycetes bacterium]MCP4087986.1 imidazole glycerol phosphate synthase subunit HisH [Actinomycetes bacterium]